MLCVQLESGSNGKYTLPKGQELQSLDMHFPSNQSLGESSPWSSERQSQASDVPNQGKICALSMAQLL